jgi:hypothetical protein
MSRGFSDYFWRGVAFLGLLTFFYTASYLALVSRNESTSFVTTVPEGELTHKNVGACWKGGAAGVWIGHRLFAPAYKLDARSFRRHFWSPYSFIVAAGRTNVTYECDKK